MKCALQAYLAYRNGLISSRYLSLISCISQLLISWRYSSSISRGSKCSSRRTMNYDIYKVHSKFVSDTGLCTDGTDFEFPTFYKPKNMRKLRLQLFMRRGQRYIGKILSKADKSNLLELSEDLSISKFRPLWIYQWFFGFFYLSGILELIEIDILIKSTQEVINKLSITDKIT